MAVLQQKRKNKKVPLRSVNNSDVAGLYSKGLNATAIARINCVSVSYIARLLRKLKKDNPGLINNWLHESSVVGGVSSKKNVHAQRVRAFVHWSSKKYLSSSNAVFNDFVNGVDVSCQGKYIYLRAKKKKFFAENESKAMWKSLSFWNDVMLKLENRLDVIIIKKGCKAFEFIYQEWETGDSVVARDSNSRGYPWRVFHSDDGKLRLSADWSDGTPNHETHHKRDAHVDSMVFEKHVNSILDNPSAPTFSELSVVVKDIALCNKETANGLNAVVEVLKTQFPKKNVEVVDSNFERWMYG